jgi:hypothetical protein
MPLKVFKQELLYITRIFILLNFSQNYGITKVVQFCIHVPVLTFFQAISLGFFYFTGYLHIYSRCSYYQDFYFLQFFSHKIAVVEHKGPSWSWLYGSWIYNYLCNQCYHHLSCKFKPSSWWGVLNTTLCDKVGQWLATGPYSGFLYQ